jgi:uncharacterized protein
LESNPDKIFVKQIMLNQQQHQIIQNLASQYNLTRVGVFGSYARGEAKTKSDLDILIDFDHKINLLELIGLEQELSDKLGVKVDLVTARSIHPKLKKHIYKDLIMLI